MAAEENNGICSVGVAYNARIGGNCFQELSYISIKCLSFLKSSLVFIGVHVSSVLLKFVKLCIHTIKI